MTDLTLRLALTSVLSANVDRGGDRHGLLLAMRPARQPAARTAVSSAVQPARPDRPAPRVPAPCRPLDDLPGGTTATSPLAAVHPLRPQFPPGGDDPAAA